MLVLQHNNALKQLHVLQNNDELQKLKQHFIEQDSVVRK